MSIAKAFAGTACLLSTLVWGTCVHAQEKGGDELAKQMVGMWDFVIENVNEVVYLRIDKLTPKPEGGYAVDAVYGWPTKERPVKSAELAQSDKELRLIFTAHNGGNSKAVLSGDGSFLGTWDYKSYPTRAVRIVKMPAGTESAKAADAAITRPTKDVPPNCAAFVGSWTGTWGYGIGQTWLWVGGVDAKCVAKVAYFDYAATPRAYEDVEIKNDTLEWMCNKSTRGTCRMTVHGDELWANYSNPAGGTNSAVFKKLR